MGENLIIIIEVYPAVSEFYQMLRIYERKNDEPVW